MFILSLVLMGSGHLHAHGGGGPGELSLESRESVALYSALIQAMKESEANLSHQMADADFWVSVDSRAINLNTGAFSKLIDRALALFRHQMSVECPECYHQKKEIQFESFKQKVTSQFQKYLSFQLNAMKSVFVNPGQMAPKLVSLAADGARLFAFHGTFYLLYTALTEAIESVFMGPFHWACPLFQALYFPAAFVTDRVWQPLVSPGLGVGIATRLGLSLKAMYLVAKFRIQMRAVTVEARTGDQSFQSTLRRQDYMKHISGMDHHIEDELGLKYFWAETYKNFHFKQNTTREPLLNLESDLRFVFGHMDDSEPAESFKFYTALKHVDGLTYMHKLLVHSVEELHEAEHFSSQNHFKVSKAIGKLGYLLENYKRVLFTGALLKESHKEAKLIQFDHASFALREIENIFAQMLFVLDPKSDQSSLEKYFTNFEEAQKSLSAFEQNQIMIEDKIDYILDAINFANTELKRRLRFRKPLNKNCVTLLTQAVS